MSGEEQILIVEDDEQTANLFRYILKKNGFENVVTINDGIKINDILAKNNISLILLDLALPSISGRKLLPEIRHRYPNIEIIVITGTNSVPVAVECIKAGAFDYLTKPVEKIKFINTIKRALQLHRIKTENEKLKNNYFRNTVYNSEAFSHIVTNDPKMKSIFIYIESISTSNEPVLITGETGVGKELIADAINHLSGRKGEYIKVNVSGLDDTIFTDTLFGHLKGSFTNAIERREGLVEKARKGTLFLDEIADLDLSSQIKLLRFLENGEYFPIGSDNVRKTDVRIICATNKNLKHLVEEGKFRNDLYYRLFTHEINIPPLRERKNDIPILTDYYITIASKDLSRKIAEISPGVYDLLSSYNFPGNIRELRAIIYNAVSQCKSGKLRETSFKNLLKETQIKEEYSIREYDKVKTFIFQNSFPTIKEAIDILVNEAIKRSSNQIQAARLLGISPAALSKRLKKKKKKNQKR